MCGGVFLEVLSICVFHCFSVFHPLWLVLFHTVDVSILSWVLTLFATVFVHRVVTSVRPLTRVGYIILDHLSRKMYYTKLCLES